MLKADLDLFAFRISPQAMIMHRDLDCEVFKVSIADILDPKQDVGEVSECFVLCKRSCLLVLCHQLQLCYNVFLPVWA